MRPTPEDIREDVITAICEVLDDHGLTEVSDAVAGAFFDEDEVWLDKAKNELHNSMRDALRRIVRLAKRLDYL